MILPQCQPNPVFLGWYTGSGNGKLVTRMIMGIAMQKARRAQAVAVAQAQEAAKAMRLRLLVICISGVAAILALPSIF